MRVIVFTEYGNNFRDIAAVSVPIMREYCEKQKYGFRELILKGTGNEYYYKKHEFIRELLDGDEADLIFYLDCDSVITNYNIRLESFMTYGAQFWITEHIGELNGGAILVKASNRGSDINNFILAHRDRFPNEQNVVNHYRDVLLYANTMAILKHPAFNSLDYSCYPECKECVGREDLGDWKPGNFVIHFPALPLNKRVELMKEFSQKIIR